MKKHIIFVDDEENVLAALKRSLRSKTDQWDMAFVPDGKKALELMQNQNFDAIISDMQMPIMSGEELLEQVKEQFPGTTRIILSGHCNQSTAFRLVGSDHFYLSKPCDRELFINTIEQAIYFHGHIIPEQKVFTNEELSAVIIELVRGMLLHGAIKFENIPQILHSEFTSEFLHYFAPMLDDQGHVEGSIDTYISDYLDDDEAIREANTEHWFIEDNEDI